jgi:hypothetical protein
MHELPPQREFFLLSANSRLIIRLSTKTGSLQSPRSHADQAFVHWVHGLLVTYQQFSWNASCIQSSQKPMGVDVIDTVLTVRISSLRFQSDQGEICSTLGRFRSDQADNINQTYQSKIATDPPSSVPGPSPPCPAPLAARRSHPSAILKSQHTHYLNNR